MNTEKKRWHQAKHEAKIQEWREIVWECRHSGQGGRPMVQRTWYKRKDLLWMAAAGVGSRNREEIDRNRKFN